MRSVNLATPPPGTVKFRSEDLEIVPARLEDMPLIADFVRSSAHWYAPFLDEKDVGQHQVDDKWGATNFAKRDFFLGVVDGVPVGTISLQYFGDYAYLGYIYLDVEQVGRGYGGRLITFAEAQTRAKGMRGMVLIGHPKATWARSAYLKYGFEIVASSKDDVLNWQDGVLRSYYEENFELYLYEFAQSAANEIRRPGQPHDRD